MQPTTEATSSTGVSNQLATLVPTFDPAKDDVTVYGQKVQLVLAAWPKSKITELITRLILNCQGSAFQKLQLHHAELLTGDETSVTKLVEILGGTWGRIPLEKQYEEAEQALYHTVQRADESNDSFLARADILWSKLLARKMDLETLQAYITLRGSCLSPEDKKRVVMESEKDGALTMKRVSEAVRTLGATFFHDVTGQKRSQRTKVYDQSALVAETEIEASEGDPALTAAEEISEEDYLEQLVNDGDPDAILIADFETAAQETVQEDESLAAALTSYQQARHRLSERFRNRGFFPTRPFQGGSKGKSTPFKGGGKGKYSGSWNQRPKKSLQDRIMQSTCRLCNQRGHWKAECPYRTQSSNPSSGNAGSGSAAPTTTVVSSAAMVDSLPMEFLNLPEEFEMPLDADAVPQQCPASVLIGQPQMVNNN